MSEYVGYVTRIKNIHKHPNADRLMIGECFGNSVIVSSDYHEKQLGVYFPTDGQLSEAFCAANDLVRRKDENGNQCGGYLDPDKRNVRTVKLRGEPSDGLFLPITCLAEFGAISDFKEGDTISTINGVEICRKYIPRRNVGEYHSGKGKEKRAKANFAPTFYEHVDTLQLAYNLNAFKPGDVVELTLKMHGTSGRTGYLPLLHTKRTWLDKLFHRHGKDYTEYGYVTGTRRVVLDDTHDGGYYEDSSFRRAMAAKFEGKLHKGFVVYYEIVGYQGPNGAPIMSTVSNKGVNDKAFIKQYGETTEFSYGCDRLGNYEAEAYNDGAGICEPCCDIYVYRMTQVNEDGDVVELSPDQMRYYCEQMGIKTVPLLERFIIPEDCDPGEYVLRKVEQYYDGPDPIGKTHVREGVVARIVSAPTIKVYKHKNIYFKIIEGLAKDTAAAPDIEEAQDVTE